MVCRIGIGETIELRRKSNIILWGRSDWKISIDHLCVESCGKGCILLKIVAGVGDKVVRWKGILVASWKRG